MKTSTRLRARSVSRRIHDLVGHPRAGRVLAAFTRSCYLDLDGRIVALVAPELLNGPLNLVVDATGAALARIAAGRPVTSTPITLDVAGTCEIALDGAVVWDAALPRWPRVDAGALTGYAVGLGRLLASEAPEGGLARLVTRGNGPAGAAGALERAAAPAVADLAGGLRRRDAHLAASAARTLAGLGPGLTPSGDDILLGCLLALALLPVEGVDGIRDVIVSSTRDRTTRISQAYLDAAARGEAGEPWHRLIAELAPNQPASAAAAPSQGSAPGGTGLAAGGTARVTDAARRVMRFGETSGSDMLAGFLLSVNALVA